VQKISGFRKTAFFIALGLILTLTASVAMAVKMNGKEVTPYVGHIVSHNNKTGEIVVKTDNSTGHWRLHRNATVLNEGKASERLNLADIWHNTKKVRVWVTGDGEVMRISVLEWKK
jgi:hypothetical protein